MIATHRRRWASSRLLLAVAGVVVLLLAGAVGAIAAAGGNGQGSSGVGNSGSAPSTAAKPLTVSVAASTPVAPGRAGAVTVRVTNPNSQSVLLTRLSGQVTGVTSGARPGLPRCSASWISLNPWTGSRTVASKADTTLVMPVNFTNLGTTNQDNCKGVSYTFSFTVNGQQA